MSLGPLYVLFGEVSVQVFCSFFNWVVFFLEWSHVNSLYILEIKPLSQVSLANMFSHTVGSLFILMLFSLAMQELFILMRSYLFILSFIDLSFFCFSQPVVMAVSFSGVGVLEITKTNLNSDVPS